VEGQTNKRVLSGTRPFCALSARKGQTKGLFSTDKNISLAKVVEIIKKCPPNFFINLFK